MQSNEENEQKFKSFASSFVNNENSKNEMYNNKQNSNLNTNNNSSSSNGTGHFSTNISLKSKKIDKLETFLEENRYNLSEFQTNFINLYQKSKQLKKIVKSQDIIDYFSEDCEKQNG